MKERLRKLVIPGYLLFCLLLGGSAQGIWSNMTLQIIAVGLVAWAALAPAPEQLTRASKLLLGLVVIALLLIVLQLVPLPAEVWTRLPGRDFLESGYNELGYSLPWLPTSMTPYETLGTALTLLPPLAVLVGIVGLRAYEESWLAAAVVVGTFLSVLLGAMQTLWGRDSQAWWYLYEVTNTGAVGFFANRNHMGTLLLVTIPFAVALFASGQPQLRSRGGTFAMLAMGAGGFLVVLVGLVLNGSLAAVALALPVITLSALILPTGWRLRRLSIPAAALALIAALVVLTTSRIHADLTAGFASTSAQSRQGIWQNTGSAITDSFPAGTGLGSFQQVYPLYEEPSVVDLTYINHAHNDYLELALETGIAGVLLMLAFFLWWVRQALHVWQSRFSSHFAMAGTIASAAILAHSVVDYPLRTAAIAAVFAASLGVMAQSANQRKSSSNVIPPRHLTIR